MTLISLEEEKKFFIFTFSINHKIGWRQPAQSPGVGILDQTSAMERGVGVQRTPRGNIQLSSGGPAASS